MTMRRTCGAGAISPGRVAAKAALGPVSQGDGRQQQAVPRPHSDSSCSEVVEHKQAYGRRKITQLATAVDIADKRGSRRAALSGNLLHPDPECLFEAYARPAATNHDRALHHQRLHSALFLLGKSQLHLEARHSGETYRSVGFRLHNSSAFSLANLSFVSTETSSFWIVCLTPGLAMWLVICRMFETERSSRETTRRSSLCALARSSRTRFKS
jgi:hypothetical protein